MLLLRKSRKGGFGGVSPALVEGALLPTRTEFSHVPSLRALPPKLTFLPGSPEKTLERTGRNIIRNPPQQRRAGGGAAPSARGAPPAHRPRGSGDQGLGRSKPPALGAGTGPRRAAVPSPGLRPEAAAQTGRLPGGAGRGRRGAGARRRARRGRLRGRSPGVTSAPGARGPRGPNEPGSRSAARPPVAGLRPAVPASRRRSPGWPCPAP